MALTEINWKPTKGELRIFAVALAFLIGLLAAFIYQTTASIPVAATLSGVAVLLAALGLIRPRYIKPIYLAWMILFYPVRWIVSAFLIAVVYYLVIFPIGMTLRMCGYDLVGRHFEPRATTYWKEKKESRKEENYFRQF